MKKRIAVIMLGAVIAASTLTLASTDQAGAATAAPIRVKVTCSTTGPDAATIPVGVLTQVPAPVQTRAKCPGKATKVATGPVPDIYVTFGQWVYIHLTPTDVATLLYSAGIAGWPVVLGSVCAAAGLNDPPVGLACGIMVAEFGLWIPGLIQTAWNRNHGGIVFENLYGLNIYSYYYSGNGQ